MCGEQDSPWCGAAWYGEHPSESEQGGEAWEECVGSQASDKAEVEVIQIVIVYENLSTAISKKTEKTRVS